MRRGFFKVVLGLLWSLKAVAAQQDGLAAVRALEALAARDNFAPAPPFYSGAPNAALRDRLNAQLRSTIARFIAAAQAKASQREYLSLLASELDKFQRGQLDSEDAEQVATNFEHIMDCVGLQSSNGILNMWVYGFVPRPKTS
jgi:hypothetical protein